MENEDIEKKVQKKYLTDHKKARKYLNQVINEFNVEDKPDVTRYRALTYMLKTMLDFFQFEKHVDIEDRINKIERRLEEMENEKP